MKKTETPNSVFEWAGDELDKVVWGDCGLGPVVRDIVKKALAKMEIAAAADSVSNAESSVQDDQAAFDKALFDYGMAFSESTCTAEIKAAREHVLKLFTGSRNGGRHETY